METKRFEIREGNGNDGCYHRGYIEARDPFDALRKASRAKMIWKPKDAKIRDIDGDDMSAYWASYASPIFGDCCRWLAESRLIEE